MLVALVMCVAKNPSVFEDCTFDSDSTMDPIKTMHTLNIGV